MRSIKSVDIKSVYIETGYYISVSQAAEALPFEVVTIRGWARDGKIEAIKVDGMGYLLQLESLMAYSNMAKAAGDGSD